MTVKATATAKTLTLEEKVGACALAEEQGRHAYALKDDLLADIVLEASPGEILTAKDGRRFMLVDNWAKAKKNKKYRNPTLWAHAGARRWELEPVKP